MTGPRSPGCDSLTRMWEADRTVVRLVGEIDMATAGDAAETLSNSGLHVRVDLTDVSFLDSSGIRVLVGAWEARVARGGSFEVFGVSHGVRRALEIAGVLVFLAPDVPNP